MKPLPNILTIVKNRVYFQSYRDGRLTYKVTVDGDDFLFPVYLAKANPKENKIDLTEDLFGVTFPLEDKGLFFMRWIRKAIAADEFVALSPKYYHDVNFVTNEITGKVNIMENGTIIGSQG